MASENRLYCFIVQGAKAIVLWQSRTSSNCLLGTIQTANVCRSVPITLDPYSPAFSIPIDNAMFLLFVHLAPASFRSACNDQRMLMTEEPEFATNAVRQISPLFTQALAPSAHFDTTSNTPPLHSGILRSVVLIAIAVPDEIGLRRPFLLLDLFLLPLFLSFPVRLPIQILLASFMSLVLSLPLNLDPYLVFL